jgi:hypothetical protein
MVENHIESPLVLVSRPVIRDGVFTEDLAMNGVELASNSGGVASRTYYEEHR